MNVCKCNKQMNQKENKLSLPLFKSSAATLYSVNSGLLNYIMPYVCENIIYYVSIYI